MPIYEFKCASCGQRFEKLCNIGENGGKFTCPKCGKAGPGRVMSGFASKGSDKGGFAGTAGSGCGGCTSSNCGSCH